MARGQGRKIDTLKFVKDGFTIEVPIYLKRDGPEEQSKYHARLQKTEPPIDLSVQEFDLDECRKKIKEVLDQQVGLKWEDWLLIHVSGEQYHPGGVQLKLNNALDIHYTHVAVSEIPGMGKVHRFPDSDSYVRGYGQMIHGGVPSTEPDRMSRNVTKAFIKKTPENMAAIEAILHGLDALRDRLRVFLSQDKIEHTLANLNTLPLLGVEKGKDAGATE